MRVPFALFVFFSVVLSQREWELLDNTGPVPRWNAVGWTDLSGKIWIFGGWNETTYFNDLWVYDNNNWNEILPSNIVGNYTSLGNTGQPSSRINPSIIFDSTGILWLYGGSFSLKIN